MRRVAQHTCLSAAPVRSARCRNVDVALLLLLLLLLLLRHAASSEGLGASRKKMDPAPVPYFRALRDAELACDCRDMASGQ